MRMHEIDFTGPPPIDGYGPGGFRISGAWHEGALVILPNGPASVTGIDAATIERVLTEGSALDLLVIGQGAEIAPLDKAVRTRLETAGIGVEVMSTPSACRTYNVLLTEGRRVGVLLIPI